MNPALSVRKAKIRASKHEDFFYGAEALMNVAKVGGAWNWALVGPDPDELPLFAGGSGGIEEMRVAIQKQKHAHSFGLLRMSFGVIAEAKHRFLFVHTADPIDSGSFSSRERGKAAAMVPLMEKALKFFVSFTMAVRVEEPDQCTAEFFISKLTSVVSLFADAHLITLDRYHEALREHKELHGKADEHSHPLPAPAVGRPSAISAVSDFEQTQPVLSTVDDMAEDQSPRQRQRVKIFKQGDFVEVWSNNSQTWLVDGEVVRVAQETVQFEGKEVVAGSMMVVYNQGRQYKWVPPLHMEEYLRPSSRPKPPPIQVGDMLKLMHSYSTTGWSRFYFELRKGYLHWWASADNVETGAEPIESVLMLGLQVREKDAFLRFRTDSAEGEVYSLRCESEEERERWVEAFWLHAGFCEDMAEFVWQAEQEQGGDWQPGEQEQEQEAPPEGE